MTKIDGVLFKRMLLSGGNNLYNHYPEVDSLNVFPIPDGDTGTNMNLTFSSGSSAVFAKNETSISDVAKTFAHGLIFGARGNSGVITSQIFGGFAKGLEGKAEVDAITFANAWMTAKDVAYRTVKVPVEGTILTVIREASQALYEKVEKDMSIAECMDILYEEALQSLKRTPDLLPVLKDNADLPQPSRVSTLPGFLLIHPAPFSALFPSSGLTHHNVKSVPAAYGVLLWALFLPSPEAQMFSPANVPQLSHQSCRHSQSPHNQQLLFQPAVR